MARCANGWFATSPKGRHRFCSLLPEYGDNTTKCVKNTARHQDISLLAMYYIYIYIKIIYIYIEIHIVIIYLIIYPVGLYVAKVSWKHASFTMIDASSPSSLSTVGFRSLSGKHHAGGDVGRSSRANGHIGRYSMAVVKTWRGKNSVPKLWTYHQIWIALPWHPDLMHKNDEARECSPIKIWYDMVRLAKNVCHTPDEGTQVGG